MKLLKYFFAIVFVGHLIGCSAGDNRTNVELIQDMMDQINNKSQDWDQLSNQPSNRVPPANTVPRGFKPYPYKGDPIKAEAELKNPFAGDFSPEILEVGKKNFDIYCALCHGPQGLGDGQIADKMALKPPSLLSDKIMNYKDGRIFHTITDGYGVMGSYSRQIIVPEDRWKVVNYVRVLQKGQK